MIAFGAAWCPPWRALDDVLADLADDRRADAVAVVDVDERPDLADRFDVAVLPTFVRVDAGAEQRRLTGAVGRAQLAALAGATARGGRGMRRRRR